MSDCCNLEIYSPCSPHRSPPFCDCEFPQNTVIYKGHIPDLIRCRCGEDEHHQLQWTWQSNDTDHIFGPDCIFHPTYSQGTSIVAGTKPLEMGMIHFWEMRILTPLVGTDVMFGIGTQKVNLQQFKFHFISALGASKHTWGLSYNGRIQHNGLQRTYGRKFSQGCIVGVYLDLSLGYLEYYLNRRSMGIAFQNIPINSDIQYYPMISSTAAKSVIRLLNATSQIDCLQFRAFKSLTKNPKSLAELNSMPGFRSMLQNYWFLSPPVRYSMHSSNDAKDIDLLDEAVLSNTNNKNEQIFDDTHSDLYAILLNEEDGSDDEQINHIEEYIDEYFHYVL